MPTPDALANYDSPDLFRAIGQAIDALPPEHEHRARAAFDADLVTVALMEEPGLDGTPMTVAEVSLIYPEGAQLLARFDARRLRIVP